MSLEICVLGSGSAGNSTLLRTPGGSILLDAGFGPRVTAQRLHGTGVEPGHIAAICLTHLDHDHFNPNWLATIVKQKIRVFCHESSTEQILDCIEQEAALAPSSRRTSLAPLKSLVVPFSSTVDFSPLPGLTLQPIHFAHDAAGSHGFLISAAHHRMGFATDLGQVPEGLISLFAGVDVLAMESNYDVDMEKNSDRPYFLKQRIMGGAGHLSNDQAYAAIRAILDHTEERHGAHRLPRHIVLLHRSRQCNCPHLLRRHFERDPRIKRALTLTDQKERTGWLRLRTTPAVAPATGRQLQMAWG